VRIAGCPAIRHSDLTLKNPKSTKIDKRLCIRRGGILEKYIICENTLLGEKITSYQRLRNCLGWKIPTQGAE